ncbi:MAG: hypothetical protein LUC92_10080, partial [Clostridiales bacterium]|nr:hypothetical protein [Clostridiales bacterium]
NILYTVLNCDIIYKIRLRRGQYMPVSKAQQRATSKYVKGHYDEIKLRVKKGEKDLIKAYAEEYAESINGFVSRVVFNEIKYRLYQKLSCWFAEYYNKSKNYGKQNIMVEDINDLVDKPIIEDESLQGVIDNINSCADLLKRYIVSYDEYSETVVYNEVLKKTNESNTKNNKYEDEDEFIIKESYSTVIHRIEDHLNELLQHIEELEEFLEK